MNNAQYITTSRALIKLAEVISLLELEEFIDNIEKAIEEGPRQDPGLYEMAKERMDKTLALAKAALALKQARAAQRGENEAMNASNKVAAESYLMGIM